MSETATFLKVGSTAILLAMVEDNYFSKRWIFDNPIASMRQVSHDLSLRLPLKLRDGSTVTALEIQWDIFNKAKEYIENGGDEFTGGPVAHSVVTLWERVLAGLETDPYALHREIDWVAKKLLLEKYAERKGISFSDYRIRSLAVQYHDIRKGKSITDKLGLEKIVTTEEARSGVINPPVSTRAYFRGMCLQKWPESIVSANWDSIVFKLDDSQLRRIPILEPMHGSAAAVDDLIRNSDTPMDLIDALELD